MGAALLSGCGSSGQSIPAHAFATPLDRYAIGVRETNEFLEIQLDGATAPMREDDRFKLRGFVRDYAAKGHGPLVLSVPETDGSDGAPFAAVIEAREIAFEAGVEYREIFGGVYDAGGDGGAPLIVAYKAYEAVAPDCPTLAEQDLADLGSNNEIEGFGCTVNANIAVMLAEPGDVLGQRVLDPGDAVRRRIQFELYRDGQPTGAARGDGDSGAVSTAVN